MVSNERYSYMDEASINQLLICRFCKNPYVEPVKTPHGDLFCKSCVTQFLRQNSSSESSRTSIYSEQQKTKLDSLSPVIEPIVLAMLDQLLVQCTKCGEINIARGKLGEHENQLCTQAHVLCEASDYKCPWVGAREQLAEHSKQCKFIQIKPALESIFIEHDQLKARIQNLETQVNGLMNTNTISRIDINS